MQKDTHTESFEPMHAAMQTDTHTLSLSLPLPHIYEHTAETPYRLSYFNISIRYGIHHIIWFILYLVEMLK